MSMNYVRNIVSRGNAIRYCSALKIILLFHSCENKYYIISMLVLDALMDDIIILIIIMSAHTTHEHIPVPGGYICAKKLIQACLSAIPKMFTRQHMVTNRLKNTMSYP